MIGESLLEHEPVIRLGAFFSIFAIMALWEIVQPRRALSVSKKLRWTSNLGIVVLNTVIARLVLPMAPVAFAYVALERSWGVFNLVAWNGWVELVAAVVLLDFFIWLQHVMVHAIPLFWRLHRMHHADLDYDVTTGARFHPIEILLSLAIKFAVIALLGASPVSVLIFEVVLNATAMFNHSNVKLPLGLDAVLRLLVVTPDMHRVHHSAIARECNSNFGFNLPWWDRLFGTYMAQPQDGHVGMTIGLDVFREERDERLDQMLIQPLRDAQGQYAINRRDWD
ncbi:sterol desaturase family protein [Magnetovibrio blakemorei]|uniref:sterol desaturase family protein n=1 Tax=Magnetovibrio blakemorei TaxID=28181 RepID=UPI0009FF4757|nr:sterol desaturase family protein [Magnetovibrio blakemorei]